MIPANHLPPQLTEETLSHLPTPAVQAVGDWARAHHAAADAVFLRAGGCRNREAVNLWYAPLMGWRVIEDWCTYVLHQRGIWA